MIDPDMNRTRRCQNEHLRPFCSAVRLALPDSKACAVSTFLGDHG